MNYKIYSKDEDNPEHDGLSFDSAVTMAKDISVPPYQRKLSDAEIEQGIYWLQSYSQAFGLNGGFSIKLSSKTVDNSVPV